MVANVVAKYIHTPPSKWTTQVRSLSTAGCLSHTHTHTHINKPFKSSLISTDSGAPVYMYEFQHPPSILLPKRPSFVKADHGDELLFVFGDCFTKGHVNINGKVYAEVGSHTCLLVHVLNNNKL